jgi:hypothetical protein
MATKRRKRRMNLGRPAKEHRDTAVSLYQRAKSAHENAKGASSCPTALRLLAEAKMYAAMADREGYNVGAFVRSGKNRGKMNLAVDKLRRQLEKDFVGAIDRCSRKYPE